MLLPGGTQWLTLLCCWVQLMYSADGAGLPEIFYIGQRPLSLFLPLSPG